MYSPLVKTIEGTVQHDFLLAGIDAYFHGVPFEVAWKNFASRPEVSCMGICDPTDIDYKYFHGIFTAGYEIEGPHIAKTEHII